MNRAVRAIACIIAMIVAAGSGAAARVSAPAAGAGRQGLTNAAPLVRIYHDIMDARFEQAEQQIREGCGGAPPVPCTMLNAVLTWWRLQMDPTSFALDSQMRATADQGIAAAEAWTRREPQRGEAWFYLGAAYAVRVQFRAIRYERLAAARDGKRIKDALERALALDPSINDAYFGIGLYHYYADIAPAALKVLRFLLLLPGGNRAQGLGEMLQTRERGELLRGEADYQLHLLYLWYEHQPDRALDLLHGLHAAYPHNPLFLANIAQVQDVYLHDPAASLASWETLLREARARRAGVPELAEVWAREGLATQLDALAETDRAIEQLRPIVEARPATPKGATARAALALGKAYDRLGDRAHAVENYRLALATMPPEDPDRIKGQANERLRKAPDRNRTDAYRLSLEGWRLFERQSYAQAELTLQRSLGLDRGDGIAHYRYGRVLQARDADDPRALTAFQLAVQTRPYAPGPILAAAYYEAGRVLENQGNRSRAIEMYQFVARVDGAEPRTRELATKSISRLRAPTGSRRTR